MTRCLLPTSGRPTDFGCRDSLGAAGFSSRCSWERLLRHLVLALALLGGFVTASAQKLVVAHEMLAMPRDGGATSVAAMREQVRMWQDLGLDATMLFDIGGPGNSTMRDAAKRYHEAAAAEGYKVAISNTYYLEDEVNYVADFMHELAQPPYAAARLMKNGKVFITGYHSPGWTQQMLDRMRNVWGIDTYAEPQVFPRIFNGDPNTQNWEAGSIYSFNPTTLPIMMDHPAWRGMQGFAAWELGDSIDDQANKIVWINDATKARGKTGRGSIVAYYKGMPCQGNWMVYEGWGYERLRRSWESAIDCDIPGVEILTCNDYVESTYWDSWQVGDPVTYMHPVYNQVLLDHSGFRYFSKRYVQWYKTGVEPAITEDELYYAYRLHPRTAKNFYELSASEKAALAQWVPPGVSGDWIYRKDGLPDSYKSMGSNYSVGANWPRLSDGIHAAVRLKAPADVYINGVKVGDNLPAGEHLVVKPGAIYEGPGTYGYPLYTFGPSDFGYPTFEIRRNGVTVLSWTGELPITAYCAPGNWNIFARKAPGPTSSGPAPLAVSLSSPTSGFTVTTGSPVTVSATLSGDTTKVSRVEFYDGAALIGQKTASPWSLSWSPNVVATHSLTAKAVNSDNTSATSTAVPVTVVALPVQSVRSPYQGNRQTIAGRIEVENYDEGGANLAYSDTTAQNYGGAYRSDGVDIEPEGAGYKVSFFQAGEWMLYSVNVAKSARYVGSVRVASALTGGTFRVELDGSDISGTLTVPNTGNWANWQTVTFEADLSAGNHDLKIVGVSDSTTADAYGSHFVGNLDYIDFAEKNTTPAPTPTITAPTAGAAFNPGAAITVTATVAGDASNLNRVEFYDGSTKIGQATASPYSISWTNASAGAHSLTAVAVNNNSATATSAAVAITVNAPAPTPTITAPSAGAVVNSGAAIAVTATLSGSTASLARVEFYDGSTKIGQATASPFTVSWTGAAIGVHSVTAVAINSTGASATSAPVAVTVAGPAPTPTITAPTAGATFNPNTAITITTTLSGSTALLSRVDFYDGATKIGQASASPWSISWTGGSPGSHSLKAVAVNSTGVTATSATVTISINAAAPKPTIVTPTAGATLTAGTPITVRATLSGSTSQLSRVDFYDGGTKIGQTSASPYSVSWINATEGAHSLTAVAVNSTGASTTSAAVAVTVTAPVTPGAPAAGAVISVLSYGAKGDGTTDDTLAIRAALAAIGPVGGTVYFPAGTYRIAPQTSGGNALTLDYNNVALRGDPAGGTILSYRVFGGGNPATAWQTISGKVYRGSAIVVNGSASLADPRHGILIADLRITGNAAPTGSIASPASTTTGDGWDSSNHAVAIASGTYVSGLRLENLELDNFRGEIVQATGPTNGLLEIVNCRIHGSNAIGVSVSADARLIGNDIYDHAWACVLGDHLNRVGGFAQSGYYLGNTFEPRRTLTTNGLRGLVLRGEGDATVGAGLATDGLFLVVQNNTFKNAYNFGLIADQAIFDPIVEMNQFIDNGIAGDVTSGNIAFIPGQVSTTATAIIDGPVVRNNTFKVTGTKPSGHAVLLNSAGKTLRNVEISGNTLTNVAGASYSIRRYLLLSSAAGDTVSGLSFVNNTANFISSAVEDLSRATHKSVRPRFSGNTVSPSSYLFLDDDFYVTSAVPDIYPSWAQARVIPASDRLPVSLEANLALYPDLTEITLTVGAGTAGILLPAKSTWNRFGSDIYVAAGESVVLVKKAGRFEVKDAAATSAAPTAPATPPPAAPLSVALTAPTDGASVASGQSVNFTATLGGTTTNVSRVEFYVDGAKIGESTTAPYAFTWSPPSVGTFSAYARAIATSGPNATSASVAFTVTPPPSSAPVLDNLAHADIGSPARAGSTSFDAATGTYTVLAGGTDIWDANDEFHFDQQSIDGDADIVVRVNSISATDTWAKAGLMIRASLDANAANASVLVSSGGGVVFQRRLQSAVGSLTTAGSSSGAPIWLRLVRQGALFIGYSSTDGATWTEVDRAIIAMPRTVYVGLATASHAPALLTTAVFDKLTITALDEIYTASDIGQVGLAGSGVQNFYAGTVTVSGAGSDIWGKSDSFTFAHRTIAGDATIMSTVKTLDAAHPWAKAGLMIRDGLVANAANVLICVTPQNGIVFQYRAATGAISTNIVLAGVAAPVQLALERSGNLVSGYYSTDGVNWHVAGTVNVILPGTVQIGMAVTSRDPAALATAQFVDTGVVP